MATVNRFEDLQVWQKARLFSKAIFDLTSQGSFSTDFDHKRQLRRAVDSVMDNIAEGFGRGNRNEFVHFLSIAKGSLEESKSQLYRALDRGYMKQSVFDDHYKTADEIAGMIRKLMQYLNQSTIKGSRYQSGNPSSKVEEPEMAYELVIDQESSR
ncbi:four helix bundle protein [Siphonobacter sp. BAB-5405]|uniref:four helix bundle protein n=1 Tax=Siphonobacter sp. BAB-5405 TaxID=1864825 RepID=UPI000C7FB052|nr:four helix bundle protein [Siphonobacter sp. BAB-5405]PMD96607.1 four helix bundle protein [Siphonobacter sp. BAB-5405]